jgi:hypothetical protein
MGYGRVGHRHRPGGSVMDAPCERPSFEERRAAYWKARNYRPLSPEEQVEADARAAVITREIEARMHGISHYASVTEATPPVPAQKFRLWTSQSQPQWLGYGALSCQCFRMLQRMQLLPGQAFALVLRWRPGTREPARPVEQPESPVGQSADLALRKAAAQVSVGRPSERSSNQAAESVRPRPSCQRKALATNLLIGACGLISVVKLWRAR